jgi:glycosyltransferase involved in cell wall biosynthesis
VTDDIGLTIVICTFNRAPLLAELLDSIARQERAVLDLEVVVVDNNCTDDTANVVAKRASAFAMLRRVEEARQGLSHARNRGAAEAKRDNVLFLDDDALAPDGFLYRIAETLRAHHPDFFGGPILPHFDAPPPVWFPVELETRRYAEIAGFSEIATLSGGNFGIRKDVLLRLGPFDSNLGMAGDVMAFGEDREMVERYRRQTAPEKLRLYYDPELAVLHRVSGEKLTKAYQLRRSYATARARERVFIQTGVRGAAAARILALVRLVLAPFSVVGTLLRAGVGARGRFLSAAVLWGLAGRFAGAFSS